MSLKSIEKNYTNFLQMFKDMGVTLTESQKETLDTFMLDLENTIDKTRDDAIRATKKIVEEKLEKEYKTVIGSIFESQKKIDSYKTMIKDKINESKTEPLINKLDEFLDEHLESVISRKQIVDYTRLQKLEQIQESMKDMLVGKMIEEGTEEKISKLQKDLNESIQCNIRLMKQIEQNSNIISESKDNEEKKDEVNADAPAPSTTTDVPSEEKAEETPVDDGEKNLEEAITDILENNEKKDETPSSETTDKAENNSTEANVEGTEPEAKDNAEDDNNEEDDSELFQESMISWIGTLEKQQYTKL